MMQPSQKPRDASTAQSRAREERMDVLVGTRGEKADHALRHSDLEGPIADLALKIVLAELKKRGL